MEAAPALTLEVVGALFGEKSKHMPDVEIWRIEGYL